MELEEITDEIAFFNWASLKSEMMAYLPGLLANVISALVLLVVGLWLIKLVKGIVRRMLARREADVSVQTFLEKLVSIALKILLFLAVATKLGIQTTSFITAIGAAGLAIGLALQGSLSNFAGGVLILLFKPFRVGDYISSSVGAGIEGTVQSIDIFHTKITTLQNQLLVIPNGAMSNSNIKNFSINPIRKTGINIRVPYQSDLNKVKAILLETVSNHPSALKDPAPQVTINGMNEQGVNLYISVTAKNETFWSMREALLIACKEAMEKEGIPIFYVPQPIKMTPPAMK